MNETKGKTGRVWLVLLAGAAAYVVIVSFADVSESLRHAGRVSAERLSLAVLFSVGSLVARAVRWQYFAGLIGVALTPWEALLTFLSGVAMSITPGKVGELVKCMLLKEEWDVPIERSAPLVLAERITDLIAVLLLGGAGVFVVPRAALVGVAAIGLSAVVLVLFVSPGAAAAALHVASRLPFVARHQEKVSTLHASLRQVSRVRPVSIAMVLAVIAWGLQGLVVYVLAGAFEGAALSIPGALVASNAPLLAGALALIPGGLGAAEASMAGILVWIGGPGLTKSVAVVVMLLSRVACFWFAIILGLAGMFAWRLRRRSRRAARLT